MGAEVLGGFRAHFPQVLDKSPGHVSPKTPSSSKIAQNFAPSISLSAEFLEIERLTPYRMRSALPSLYLLFIFEGQMGVFMHNRTTAHASAIAAGVLLALFAALTVSLVFVDRQPIAGDGSLVGLATFNLDARAILGQNDLMEKLSNALLVVPAVGALMLAIVGCKQLIRSRSRGGVDRDLWLLLGTYAAMLVLYVLFNCISPNNRPILEDGVCEPSFPSSHTLLAVTMCGTAMIQAVQRIREGGLRTAALVICAAGMVGIVAARAMAGVHWATDILGGILLGAALVAVYRTIAFADYGKASRGKHARR